MEGQGKVVGDVYTKKFEVGDMLNYGSCNVY